MSPWPARIAVLILMVVIVGLPFAWQPHEPASDARALRLVIISPHNEQIRYETEAAFSDWHEQQFGQPIEIDWRSVGGTSDIERLLESQYTKLAEAGRADEGVGIDLVFGGGDYSHEYKFKRGVTVTMPDGQKRQVSITQPIGQFFTDAFIAEVYPDPMIADRHLYDPDGYWWGIVLSSFGIVYNRDVLHVLQIDEPRTWSDLADGRLIGWIALADPSHSGSVRVTYEAILQRYGFDRGIATLRRAFANARYFTASSSRVPIDVSAGEAAAGMCIDFYGRFQAQQVGQAALVDGPRVAYVAPAGQTLITADPIAVLRGVKDVPGEPMQEQRLTLSLRFIRFLLSERGQALWCMPVGDPMGPREFELRRLPVRRGMYDAYLERMTDAVNPFLIAEPVPEGTPSYFSVVPVLLHAMCMDVHDDLRAAWGAINETSDLTQRAAMLAMFDALPFTQQQLLNAPDRWKRQPGAKDADRLTWTRFFREKYRQVAAMER
jgi:hypothetical protein